MQHSGVTARKGLWDIHYDPYDVSRVWVRDHWNPRLRPTQNSDVTCTLPVSRSEIRSVVDTHDDRLDNRRYANLVSMALPERKDYAHGSMGTG